MIRRGHAPVARRAAALLAVPLLLTLACGDAADPAPAPGAEAPSPVAAMVATDRTALAATPPEQMTVDEAAYEPRPPGTLTFSRDIAPIIWERCTPCHREGEAAPFVFASYRDVKKRMRQVATVTKSRFMPPWLPAPGHGDFADPRVLTGEQIGMIQQWVREGAPEGDPAETPPLPEYVTGWRLGKPDREVTLPEAYSLRADGFDVFRNFVIPDVVTRTRYVRGLEFRARNPRVIHHAEFMIDETELSAQQDAREEGPGYSGMHGDGAHSPRGHFLGWVPGKTPFVDPGGMSWPLDPGTDLVVQLHMLPSGKPESVQPTLGLFFSDEPPRHDPLIIRLGSRSMDIPAGEADYVIRDSMTLPVDVQVLSVLPHAHYLGKDIKAWATLPDGTKRWLVWVPDWDFNWQDSFRFTEPVPLPAGTILSTEFVFDNSAENVRNPHTPPRRVVFGPSTYDEMADLWLQLLPDGPAQREVLRAHFVEKENLDRLALARRVVEADPESAAAHLDLGTRLLDSGQPGEAMEHLREVIRIDPGEPLAYHNLAVAFMRQGRPDQGAYYFGRALEADPEHLDSLLSLSRVSLQMGKVPDAIEQGRRAVEVAPDDPSAHFTLGRALQRFRDERGALGAYANVLRIEPDSPLALDASARILATTPDPALRDPATALGYAERAVALTRRRQPMALGTLATACAAAGDFDRAVAVTEEAIALVGPQAQGMAEGLRRQLEAFRQGIAPGAGG